jgi:hypothetical protein
MIKLKILVIFFFDLFVIDYLSNITESALMAIISLISNSILLLWETIQN